MLLARRTAVLACVGVLAGFGFAGLASAGFMVPGSGTGSAMVISLSAPADVTASPIAGVAADLPGTQAALDAVEQTGPAVAALEVTWDAVTIPSVGAGGYYVQRFAGDSTTPSAACGSSPSSL